MTLCNTENIYFLKNIFFNLINCKEKEGNVIQKASDLVWIRKAQPFLYTRFKLEAAVHILCPEDGSISPQITHPPKLTLRIGSCFSMSFSFNLLMFHVNPQMKWLLFIKYEVIASVFKNTPQSWLYSCLLAFPVSVRKLR